MAMVAIKIKIMPESLDINLADIKEKVDETVIKMGAKNTSFNEENIAFGLKALILTMAWPEEQDTSILESEISNLEGVSSGQIIDYRRAFG
jgi:elongation factor 1-beta